MTEADGGGFANPHNPLVYLETENVEILNTHNEGFEEKVNVRIETLVDVIGEENESSGGFEDGLKTKAFYARFLLID